MTSIITALAAAEPGAGGSPIGQLIAATVLAGTMSGGVLLLAFLHRTGRTTLLARAGDRLGRIEGMPGWAALPVLVGFASLLLAFIGVYWDIAIHLDNGRDDGPLANLAHYPILFGLQGLFLAGVLALAMPKPKAYVGPSAVRVAAGWRVPAASLTLMACAVLGYTGFPADDVWHRLFGQDVTLWGPTHLMMISGAVLSIIALAMLIVEGERAYGPAKTKTQRVRRNLSRFVVPMATLIAVSLFVGEWDWGVQQYLMVWQPVIIAAGGAFGLVLARLWGGPGFAIMVALGYAVARFVVNLAVDGVFGQTMPLMNVFFVEALLVEAVFLFSALRSRQLLGSVLAGLLIGTVGFAFQYAWSQEFMHTPWTTQLLGNGVPMAIAAGIGGSVLAFLFAESLQGTLERVGKRRLLGIGTAATLLAVGGIAGNQDYSSGPEVTTTISNERVVTPATGDGPLQSAVREATLSVTFTDPTAADEAHYVQAIAWQGRGLVSNAMEKVSPGVYRTTEPIPLGGTWKTMVRMQEGRKLLAAPVQLPADPGIPVPELSNPGTQTLTMDNEQKYLQRERKPDVPATLWTPAVVGVLGLMALFSIMLGFAAARVGLRVRREPGEADAAADAPEAPAAPLDAPAAESTLATH